MTPPPKPPSHENGLFWSHFTPEEQKALLNVPLYDLTGERNLLFMAWRDAFEQARLDPPQDHKQTENSFKAVVKVSAALGVIQRTQWKQQGLASRWDPVIRDAYALARQRFRVETYLEASPQDPPK